MSKLRLISSAVNTLLYISKAPILISPPLSLEVVPVELEPNLIKE